MQPHKLSYWNKKLQVGSDSQEHALVRVTPVECVAQLELQVGPVVKIIVKAGFDRQLLREVVDALGGAL